jgi:hypothetical protein
MNIHDYEKFAVEVVNANLGQNGRFLTAARLGLLLRRYQPAINWRDFGYSTLKEFLLVLEGKKLLRLADNEKGALAVWLPQEQFRLEPTKTQPPKWYAPLRKPFWLAFVVEQPPGRRFFNRATGVIQFGLREAPTPTDQWVEIAPISSETQKGWATEFLNSKNLNNDPRTTAALADVEWFRRFPDVLRSIDLLLVRDWNRLRTMRVSEAVQVWCTTHAIDPVVAFQSPGEASGFERWMERISRPRAHSTSTASRTDIRSHVLSALARMPTESLLEIPIPAKYLLTPHDDSKDVAA